MFYIELFYIEHYR